LDILRYGKLIGVTAIYQIIIQAVSLIAGFLIVRLIPTEEYAWYTIANTVLGMMTVISDGGINSSLMAQGGKVWQDRIAFAEIFSTAYFLRKRFALISMAIALPFLYFLLHKQHASFVTTFLIIIALIPAFFASLSDNLLQVAPKLHQNVIAIQKNSLTVSLFRFLIIIPFLFVFPFTWLIILLTGFTRMYGNAKLWRENKKYFTKTNHINALVKQNMVRQVSRLLPGTIYYCFSGQIAIWLMSLLGSNESVAGLGALARFSMMFSILTVVFGSIVTPKFSKISENSKSLTTIFTRVQLFGILSGILITIIFFIFSHYFLLLLGPSYAHLDKELTWSIGASMLGLCAGFSFSLFTSRGWSLHPVITIGINLLALTAGVICFEVNTLKGVLMMNVFVNAVQYFMNTIFCFYKIKSTKSDS
jgi:O-antigen/teichoic acid export membrane protein